MMNDLIALSVTARKLAVRMIDEGRDQDDIDRMNDTARQLENLSGEDCSCTPVYDCPVCRAVIRLYNDEEYQNEQK